MLDTVDLLEVEAEVDLLITGTGEGKYLICVCSCIHVHVHTHISMYIYVHVHVQCTYAHKYVYICTCTCMFPFTNTCIRPSVRSLTIYICRSFSHLSIYLYLSIYVCMYIVYSYSRSPQRRHREERYSRRSPSPRHRYSCNVFINKYHRFKNLIRYRRSSRSPERHRDDRRGRD